ncbi:M3 family oligoendopeptidase [Deinococcus sp.]|uniref:M3 family oligoendopeptidase n=1 Tax=Deinococcus sp. TaxID=47478 RepID=UPI0025E2ED9F|nr:M3 family oligoendopeptidase [Deinococcus sp.]
MTTTRSSTDSEPRWRTDDFFPGLDSPEYARAVDELSTAAQALGELWDRLGVRRGEQPQDLSAAFEAVTTTLNALLGKLRPLWAYVYAFTSTDSRDDLAQAKASELEMLIQPMRGLFIRYDAWTGGLDHETLKATSALARSHSYLLERAHYDLQHQMSPAEEALASELSLSSNMAWYKLRSNLSSQLYAEFGGERLSMSAIRNLADDPDAGVRQRAFEAELQLWQSAEVPLAAALNSIKGQMGILNRRRGYVGAVEATLQGNGIDRATLDAMQRAVVASFPDFRRYFRAKARTLGHADGKLPWADLFAPVGEPGRVWTYPEAQMFVEESFRSYSPRLGDFAARAFRENWIDVPPRDGKAGGAFCMNWTLGESRILLNHAPSLSKTMTLAHELGHAYHNLCLAGRTPLQRDHPMTLAETASIFCETIVQRRALASATGQERLYVLETMLIGHAQVVVDIHSRFLFESAVFEGREKREFAAAELCALMEQAQQDTYGEVLSSLHPYAWASKSHYYSSSFYNYPYTFGLLFGLGLYARYQTDPDAFRAQYDDLLSRTGMESAASLAAEFGVDIRDEAFWVSSLDVIRGNIQEYEALAATLG